MIPKYLAAIAFTVTMASLFVYWLAANQARKRTLTHPDDFFLARQRLTADDFGDTQIAYALQMSTVYPFFMLAVFGSWMVPVLNSVFWFVGIYMFLAFIPRFKPFLGKSRTIHAFIADLNESAPLRRLASLMTIIAFLGVIVFEVAYGALVFRVMFGDVTLIYDIVVACLAAYLVTYIWFGGQAATLRTEQVQLLFAYLGLHFSLAYLLTTRSTNVAGIAPSIVIPLVFAASLFMLISRIRSLYDACRARRRVVVVGYAMMSASLLALMYSIIKVAPRMNWGRLLIRDATLGSVTSLPFWGMIGTAVLIPVFWQFADLTNWQRICSLSAVNPDEYAANAKRGLVEYLIESPLSWLLAVLLGLIAPQYINLSGNSDFFEQFVRQFLTGSGISQIIGVVFVVGVVGIFMSTADSAISAVGYAFTYDFWGPTRRLIDKGNALSVSEIDEVVNTGRRFMAVSIAIVILLFIVMDYYRLKETYMGLLFAFYGPVIALTPAVLGPVLFRKRPTGYIAYASILAGALSGLYFGIRSAWHHPELQWYGAPVAFLVSWGIYCVGTLFSGHRVIGNETNLAE